MRLDTIKEIKIKPSSFGYHITMECRAYNPKTRQMESGTVDWDLHANQWDQIWTICEDVVRENFDG